MGMYDYLFINTNKLPISDEEKDNLGVTPGWQTKDFDCLLTDIHITDDGEILISKCVYIEVPKKDRLYPNANGLKGLFGSIVKDSEHFEKVLYDGCVEFYTNINDEFYEFKAIFVSGKLQSIIGGKY